MNASVSSGFPFFTIKELLLPITLGKERTPFTVPKCCHSGVKATGATKSKNQTYAHFDAHCIAYPACDICLLQTAPKRGGYGLPTVAKGPLWKWMPDTKWPRFVPTILISTFDFRPFCISQLSKSGRSGWRLLPRGPPPKQQ